MLALQQTGLLNEGVSSLAFVEYYQIGAPAPHPNRLGQPVWSNMSISSERVQCSHTQSGETPSSSESENLTNRSTKTTVSVKHSILLSDSASRCMCVSIPVKNASLGSKLGMILQHR